MIKLMLAFMLIGIPFARAMDDSGLVSVGGESVTNAVATLVKNGYIPQANDFIAGYEPEYEDIKASNNFAITVDPSTQYRIARSVKQNGDGCIITLIFGQREQYLDWIHIDLGETDMKEESEEPEVDRAIKSFHKRANTPTFISYITQNKVKLAALVGFMSLFAFIVHKYGKTVQLEKTHS